MDNMKKRLTIFIKKWIYCLCTPDGSKVFIGIEALHDEKQKLYVEGQMEYKIVASGVPELEDARLGDLYRVIVEEEVDPIHGHQWRVISAVRIEPAVEHEIRKFLQQIKEKCLTHKRRDTLINAYGAKTLDTVLADPSALNILKTTQDRKDRIYRAIAKNRSFADLLAFLAKRKWDCRLALPVYNKYKENAISTLRTNPYQLFQDELTSFGVADRIFLSEGGADNAPLRCRMAVLAALRREAKQDGGVFIPRKELREKISRLVKNAGPFDCDLPENDITKALSWLKENKDIYIDCANGREDVYLTPFYHVEIGVANSLKALCQAQKSVTCREYELDQFLAEYMRTKDVRLTSGQCAAVKLMLTAPVSVVTGGPGTGKTLLVEAAISALQRLHSRAVIQCCAPTGKAADRMPAEACTIDRMTVIENCKYINQTGKGAPDIFFVDEGSMVDLEQFAELLAVIPAGARLVIIGDQNQLPSIKAGQVLRDLIDSGVIHTIHLRKVFRQKAGSSILSNAEKIIQTAADQDIHLDEDGKGFFFNRNIASPHRVVNAVMDTYEQLLKDGIPPSKIQIITGWRHGEVGVQHLNHFAQDRFNPQGVESTFCYNSKEFRLHDRVIHVKNNYDLRVFNGEVGEITAIEHSREWALTVTYPSKTIRYAEKDLEELELAYALTVHKCQGSEYDVVIIPIIGKGITRRMLYTAVTRGRQLVLLIGTESALTAEMRGENTDERASNLAPRLQRLLPPILPEVEQMSLFPPAQN